MREPTTADPRSGCDPDAPVRGSRRCLPGSRRVRAGILSAIALWATVVGLACAPRAPSRIVLIVVDTLRADHLGAYGAERATPHLDGLAARGAVVEGFLAAYHQTSMSMAALFTGLTPSLEIGGGGERLPWTGETWCGLARLADADESLCVPRGVETLAEALREAGYWTVGVVSNDFLYEPSGFGRGFDDRVEVGEPGATGDGLPAPRAWQLRTRHRVHDAAVAAIARRPHDRFFLYVHYMDVHDFGYRDLRYADAVAEADAAVGKLLAHLEASSLLDGAVVVFTADHGEHLGERHPPAPRRVRRSHLGNPSYRELLHVPLIVAPAPPRGTRLADVRRTQDLHRFLRRLAGADPAPEPALEPDELFLSERGWRTYVRGRFKSSFSRGDERFVLFDQQVDPEEQRDVGSEHPDVVAAHRDRIQSLSETLAARPDERREPSEEDRRRLRALGYLD